MHTLQPNISGIAGPADQPVTVVIGSNVELAYHAAAKLAGLQALKARWSRTFSALQQLLSNRLATIALVTEWVLQMGVELQASVYFKGAWLSSQAFWFEVLLLVGLEVRARSQHIRCFVLKGYYNLKLLNGEQETTLR